MDVQYASNGKGDEFYARLARDFILDADAPGDKVYRYWKEFVL